MNPEVKPYTKAEVGDDTYTWENQSWGDWGEYVFETVDPASVYSHHDLDDPIVVTRKRWRLIEVETYTLFKREEAEL